MKKIALFLTLIFILGTSSAFADTTKLCDVNTAHWAYESINYMSEKGVLAGYPDGTFMPSSTVTYGQFIKMVVMGKTGEDLGNSEKGNWAKNYYDKAIELGYFRSSEIDENQLNNIISRYDMALIISNVLGDIEIKNYDTLQSRMSDVNATTQNKYDIIKSYSTGILTGYSDGTFKPDGTLTRAEAVVVIHRLIDDTKRVYPTVTTNPTTEKTLAEMITNYKSFYTETGAINETLSKVTSYKIDNSNYSMKLVVNNGIKNILISSSAPKGAKYLVKDNKVIESLIAYRQKDGGDLVTYTSDITTVDYIAIVDGDYVMTLIKNPFKK